MLSALMRTASLALPVTSRFAVQTTFVRSMTALPPLTFQLNNIRDNKGALKPVRRARRVGTAGGLRGLPRLHTAPVVSTASPVADTRSALARGCTFGFSSVLRRRDAVAPW